MLANLPSRRGADALKADLSVERPTLEAPSPQALRVDEAHYY